MMKKLNLIKTVFIVLLTAMIFPYSAESAPTAEENFFLAETCYNKLLSDSTKLKHRENWLPCIEKFEEAFRQEPKGKYAAISLYMAGDAFSRLYGYSSLRADREKALNYFERVIRNFPKSAYAPKAKTAIEKLSLSEVQKHKADVKADIKTKCRGDIFRDSKERYKVDKTPVYQTPVSHSEPDWKAKIVGKNYTHITGLRYWSNPRYIRIVIDADGEMDYTHKFLDKDSFIDKPQRLYIDFSNSVLGENIDKTITINNNLLMGIRAGQYEAQSVRVVVDIKSFKSYKIFPLRNPYRIIIDVWGQDTVEVASASSYVENKPHPPLSPQTGGLPPPKKKEYQEPEKKEYQRPEKPKTTPTKKLDLAKQLGLRVRRIVIDPGHGGRDAGAVGYDKRVLEKDIVLDIGKRLANKIRRTLGCEVIMTRTDDRFLSLEERTAFANTHEADLFISIHTNAHTDRQAHGIETYFLNLTTDEDAIAVAARENATTRKNISDLQAILKDLMQNTKINESSRLAAYVQRSLAGYMKNRFTRVRDKGVKQAPFHVLIGADMPAILIETSFITNQLECKRLVSPAYQDHICEAILNGIRMYMKETNPTAFMYDFPQKSGLN